MWDPSEPFFGPVCTLNLRKGGQNTCWFSNLSAAPSFRARVHVLCHPLRERLHVALIPFIYSHFQLFLSPSPPSWAQAPHKPLPRTSSCQALSWAQGQLNDEPAQKQNLRILQSHQGDTVGVSATSPSFINGRIFSPDVCHSASLWSIIPHIHQHIRPDVPRGGSQIQALLTVSNNSGPSPQPRPPRLDAAVGSSPISPFLSCPTSLLHGVNCNQVVPLPCLKLPASSLTRTLCSASSRPPQAPLAPQPAHCSPRHPQSSSRDGSWQMAPRAWALAGPWAGNALPLESAPLPAFS